MTFSPNGANKTPQKFRIVSQSPQLASQRRVRATRVHGAPFTEVCANDRKPIFGSPAPPRPNEKCVGMSAL